MSQQINLYDASLRLRRDWLSFESAVAMLGIALLLVALGSGLARRALAQVEPIAASAAAELQVQQAAVQAKAEHAASVRPETALQAEIAQAQRTLLQRRSALQTIDAGGAGREAGFASRLEALARQSVDGLWLTGLVLRQDDVRLSGRALNPALIPAYVQRLEREPSLQGRAFKALEVIRPLDASSSKAALVVSPNAEAAPSAAHAAPHAEYVEFTLTGSDPAAALPADNNGAQR